MTTSIRMQLKPSVCAAVTANGARLTNKFDEPFSRAILIAVYADLEAHENLNCSLAVQCVKRDLELTE
jgi:hypothetical protein